MTGCRIAQTRIGLIALLSCGLAHGRTACAEGAKSLLVQGEIAHVGDTAHLEFRGLKTWRYDLQRVNPRTVNLNIPTLSEASLTLLRGFSDSLVESVQVDKNGPDGSYVVTFHLGQNDVEAFDYLTDDPSRLIVDFYRKVADAVKKPQTPVTQNTKKLNSLAKRATNKQNRAPAGDEILAVDAVEGAQSDSHKLHSPPFGGIFDGGDDNYDRFRIKDYEVREEAIISSRQNIYLPFPMLKMKVSQLDKLMIEQPEYIIHPKETRENKEARLLLTLFERKRYAVFLKTYAYFINKYPESDYTEILKNLAAFVNLDRWKQSGKPEDFDQARALYNELVQKFPDSPLRERNYLILGFAQMERGDALATLQTFEGFIKAYPKAREIPAIRSGAAEAYMILRRYEEASAEFNRIRTDFPKTIYAEEARYRLGDVAFAEGDFSKAIREYQGAIKDYPAREKKYPNADFNMAEARFMQKDYQAALNDYINFVDHFPTHDYGGYALTRIGELLGILGADQRRVMGAFLESYFRFPNHPGAKVARIRMLSQQMKGMKPTELKKALEEIKEITDKLELEGSKEFTTVMEAEGLAHRGEYTTAIDKLITFYRENPSSSRLEAFKSRILRNIESELAESIQRGDFLKALAFNSKYSSTWLKDSGRIDIPFSIGRAFEIAGAFSAAEKIYRQALKQRLAIVGTVIEKEKKVQEDLPAVDTLRLRLATVQAQDRDYINAYQQLKAMGSEDMTPSETVERVQLSALIAEQRNDYGKAREALLELAQKWKGDPALMAPVHVQLAQTYNKMGQFQEAEEHATQALEAEGGETRIAEKTIADALQSQAEALLGQKKSLAAVESYQKLLERFESKMPLANVRYKVGDILFQRGDLKGAAAVWQHLENTPSDFLWKIGKEKLAESRWQDDYTKYINRIPAMAKLVPTKEKKQ